MTGLVSLEVRVLPVVSHAMAHNAIEFVREVRITGLPDGIDLVDVSIVLTDRGVPLSRPWRSELQVTNGSVPGFKPQVVLDAAAMWDIEEDRPAEVVVRVLHKDEVVAEVVRPTRVVSARSWQFLPDNPELAYELLGSFVMPNDPAITALVVEARVLLEQRTGSSSTEGYQSGADRVDQIVEGIWDAARHRDIAYSNPPASWDNEQKVRTPEDVLVGRAGTCLDTAVVLAAALEHVGINSTVWLLQGHAFLGYWRGTVDDFIPMNTGAPATIDASGLKNLVDVGALRIVETTAVAGGAASKPLSDEIHRSSVIRYLSGDMSRVAGVVDIYACRQSRILPLPAAARRPDGKFEVVEYRPEMHSGVHFVPSAQAQVEQDGVDARGHTIPARVQRWKNTLLDLSLRNKLINFTATGTVEVAVPDGALPHIEDLLNAGKSITLLPSDQTDHIQQARGVRFGAHLPQDQLHEYLDKGQVFTPIPTASYLTRFRGLAYKAKTIVEETGANNLYLALGSLNWSIAPKQGGQRRAVKSPLILLPITLAAGKRGGLYQVTLDESGISTPNFCLIEKLRQEDNLRIPALENPVEDEHGIDLAATFAAVRAAIAEKGLDYHVDETADLAILQFAKFRLWKDLDESWEALAGSPLVRHMIEAPGTDYLDPAEEHELGDLDELDAVCPIPADGSQLEAIAAAVAGKTFVLEGPPGTGKSQTITNLLARAVVEGKRVLFVAEKRAALDVVSARLASIGLAAFCLDLHDKSSKPAAVRAQILQALDLSVPVDEQGYAVQSQDRAASARALDLYARRLHEKNGAGLSFYSARTKALALGDETPSLPVPASALSRLTPETTATLRHLLGRLNETADLVVPRRQHPWGFVRRPVSAVEGLKDAVRRVDRAADRLSREPGPLGAALAAATSRAEVQAIHAVLTGPVVGLSDLDDVRTRSWGQARAQYEQTLAGFTQASHPGLDRANPMALDLPLDQIRAEVAAAVASGFFGRSKRLLAALAPLQPFVTVLPKRKEALPLLDALIETRSRASQVSPANSGVRGLQTPARWNPWDSETRQQLQGQISWLTGIARAVDPESPGSPFIAALRTFIGADVQASPEVIGEIGELARALDDLDRFAPGSELSDWLDGAPLLRTWSAGSVAREPESGHSMALTRWLNHLQSLEPVRAAGLDEAVGLLRDGIVPATLAARAFERGVAEASLVERRTSTGLDVFDPLAHNMAVARFAASSVSVREHLHSVIPMQIVSSRPFSSSGDRGQVGELRRQLGKQRGGKKVRALLDDYGDLITQLLPCVLVSPDSVARFFPVGSQTFDLVVFDEASQIRVADAVGAIGRSKAVVVVGDSKQMPPTSVAETVVDDEDVTQELEGVVAVPDEESILTEAVSTGLRSRALTWHYRSRDEALIAFSNEHYYENQLSSFPTPPPPLDAHGYPTAGLSLVRVDGTFLRSGTGKSLRTNPVEGEAIVAEIRRRFALSPDRAPSIGVVTFNAQQRTLIETLLRDGGDERIVEALDGTNGEGLFVKNLENVQGDERDLILFSVAFSKRDDGVLPLNFGPLGLERGERRLNVAVTRARTQVIIYCSFDPSDLRADDTKHLGIKHLRDYLDLAQRGTDALAGTASRKVADRHRDELSAALVARGLAAVTDLGLSDFKVDLALAPAQTPDAPLVAVLLDGEGWSSRRTVGDRDGLPVTVLGGMMGWKGVERVWLPEWLRDRDAVLDRLVDAVRRAQTDEPAPQLVPVSAVPGLAADRLPATPGRQTYVATPSAADQRIEAAADTLAGATPYVRWAMQVAGDVSWLDNLQDQQARARVGQVVNAVLMTEAPVQLQRLGKLTANAFGLSRVTPARIKAITALVPAAQRDQFGFAWRDSAESAAFGGFRTASTDDPRVLDEIHPREVVHAMVAISRAAWGISEDDLFAETLAQFGWKRRTAAAVTWLRSILEMALDEAVLTRDANGVIREG